MTERLSFHFSLSCIGEGNGNPLQCSCLENPRDGGAWWAAVYGVAQSRTWLKRLSSRSSIPETNIISYINYIPIMKKNLSFKRKLFMSFFFVVVVESLSCVWLFVIPWTAAHQPPLAMGFSRQEYCSGLPFPPLGDLSNSGIKLMPPASPALAGRFFF